MSDQLRLTRDQVVPFLRSVIASGERLTPEDDAAIEAALHVTDTPDEHDGECGYECPWTEAAHAARDTDHPFEPWHRTEADHE